MTALFLLFGRYPRLSIDLIFQIQTPLQHVTTRNA